MRSIARRCLALSRRGRTVELKFGDLPPEGAPVGAGLLDLNGANRPLREPDDGLVDRPVSADERPKKFHAVDRPVDGVAARVVAWKGACVVEGHAGHHHW